MLHNSNSRGFTIIEIITIIAIISLLSSIIAVNSSKSRSLARDGQRVSDLTTIQNALNLYFVDNKKYPYSITIGSPLSTYLNQVPKDPRGTDYVYRSIDRVDSTNPSTGCKSYHLGAKMENIGHIGLKQDKDAPVSPDTTCSSADFSGISGGSVSSTCTPSTVPLANDLCFDLTP